MRFRPALFIALASFGAACTSDPVTTAPPPPVEVTAPEVQGLKVTPARAGKGQTLDIFFGVSKSVSDVKLLVAGRPATCALGDGGYHCSYTVVGDEAPQGARTILARVAEEHGLTAEASTTVALDFSGPKIAFTTVPEALSANKSASIEFSADEQGTFSCALDDKPAAACTSPVALDNLDDGKHTFKVTGKDDLGNESAAEISFALDLKAPETTIDAAPAALSNDADATFLFSSPEKDAQFVCRLDTAHFAPCRSPVHLTAVAEGAHTFEVAAKDAFENVDATPAKASFTIDRTAPKTTIDPIADTGKRDRSLTFSATETATFECSLDQGTFVTCTSPKSFTSLPDGSHTFAVRARDAAGNQEKTAAAAVFVVDNNPPVVSIVAGPGLLSNKADPTFRFSSSKTPATFECALDGAAAAACVNPVTFTGLAEGKHSLVVFSADKYGNKSNAPASYNWTVDLTEPDTAISGTVPAVIKTTTQTVSFTSTDTTAKFQCRVDTAAFAACASPFTFTGLTEGVHTLEVRAIDPSGNVDSTSSTVQLEVDLTLPVTTISPIADTGSNSPTITFTSEAGSTFQCALDAGAFAACTSPKALTALADGNHTFKVKATDRAGNVEATAASATFVVDTTGPTATIATSPKATTNDPVALFTFGSNEVGSTFECAIDNAAFAACTTPFQQTMAEGTHTLALKATDKYGNKGTATAPFSWKVDLTKPVTSVNGAPASYVKTTTVSVGFAANETSTYECRLDGGAWATCTSPKSLSGLTEAAHLFEIRATDAAGNLEATPAAAAFTVDLTLPTTTISPVADTGKSTFDVTYVASETSTFECKLDGSAFVACGATKVTYTALPDGTHTIAVRAIDRAGNVEANPTSVSVVVDTTAPTTTFTDAPPALDSKTTANFVFAANEGATFQCSFDGAAYAACTSPQTVTAPNGTHTYEVKGTDKYGNVETPAAKYSWEVDTFAPTVQIDTAPTLTNAATVTITFSGNASNLTYKCTVDTGTAVSCTSPFDMPNLAEGQHTVSVVASNTKRSSSAATATFTVDRTAPVVTIPAVPDTGKTSRNVGFTVDDTNATVTCKLDNGTAAACITPYALTGLADGSHTVQIDATDAANNTGTKSVTFVVDTTPPTTTFSQKPADPQLTATGTFAFAANETGSTYECRLDTAAFAACTSPTTVTFATYNGPHTYEVRATDKYGNLEPTAAKHSWYVDAFPPQVIVTAKPSDPSNSKSASVDWKGNSPGMTFSCVIDFGTAQACTAPLSFQGLGEGLHSVAITATDTQSRQSPQVNVTWKVDTAAPAVAFTQKPAATVYTTTTSSSVTFAWTDDDSTATETCTLDGNAFTPCTSPATFTANIGSHTFVLKATDPANNVGQVSHAFAVALQPPAPFTVDQLDPSVIANTTPTFSWTASTYAATYTFEYASDAAFTSNVVSVPGITRTTYVPSPGLASGRYFYRVKAVNSGGTTASTNTGLVDVRTWNQLSPRPTSNLIQSVACLDANTCLFGGASGTLFRTVDGGTSFRLSSTGITNTIYSVGWVDANTALASASSGNVLRSTDGGNTWLPAAQDSSGNNIGGTSTLYSMAVKGQVAVIVGTSGLVMKTTDGGATWAKTTTPSSSASLYGVTIAATTPNLIILTNSSSGTVYKSSNGGSTWTSVTAAASTNYWTSAYDTSNAVTVGSFSGYLKRSTDGGTTWAAASTASPASNTIYFASMTDANTVWVAGTSSSSNTYSPLRKVVFGASSTTWTDVARTDTGYLYGQSLYSVSMVSTGTNTWTGFAAGSNGAIFKVVDNGTTVTMSSPPGAASITSSSTPDFRNVNYVSATKGFVFGTSGYAARTTDGGATFTTMDTDTTYASESNYCSSFIDSQVGWVGGSSYPLGATTPSSAPFIAKTSDGGATWTKLAIDPTMNTESATPINGIAFISDTVGFAVGTYSTSANPSTLLRWNPTTSTFMLDPLYTTTGAVASYRSLYDVKMVGTTGYLVGATGGSPSVSTVAKYDNGKWTQEAVPSTATSTLYYVAIIDPETAVAVGSSGIILRRSATGGWTKITSPTSNTLYAVYFSDANNGVAVGSSGTIILTADGGQTWTTGSAGVTNTLYGVAGLGGTNTLFAAGTSRTLLRNDVNGK